MKHTLFNIVISASFLVVSISAQANLSSSPEVQVIQHEWARLNFMEEFKNNNYRELNSRWQGQRRYYVRGHLLSWHLGGAGD